MCCILYSINVIVYCFHFAVEKLCTCLRYFQFTGKLLWFNNISWIFNEITHMNLEGYSQQSLKLLMSSMYRWNSMCIRNNNQPLYSWTILQRNASKSNRLLCISQLQAGRWSTYIGSCTQVSAACSLLIRCHRIVYINKNVSLKKFCGY